MSVAWVCVWECVQMSKFGNFTTTLQKINTAQVILPLELRNVCVGGGHDANRTTSQSSGRAIWK